MKQMKTQLAIAYNKCQIITTNKPREIKINKWSPQLSVTNLLDITDFQRMPKQIN